MSRSKELIKNTGILMVAKISTQIVSFLLLPLYTALLTTAQYGRVDIYTSLAMIIIPFLTLQTEMGLFRFFIAYQDDESKRRVVSSAFAIVAKCVFLFSVCFLIVSVLFKIEYAGLLYGYYLTMTISTVFLQLCRAEGNNVAYGVATFLSSAVAVALNVVFVAIFKLGVQGILLSTILAQSISIVYMAFKTHAFSFYSREFIDKKEEKRLLEYSVPLVFNQISSWAVNYSDRIIILLFWGESVNGIYSIANKFSNITSTFFGVYNVAWTENVVRCIDDDDSRPYITKIFNMTFSLYLILITGIINLLPFFFSLMVNEAYSDAYQHVPLLLLGMFFSGMAATLGSVFIAKNKTKDVSVTTTLAGICNIIVHFALLKPCKLYAASISTMVAFGALFAYRYIFVNKFFEVKFNVTKVMPHVIAFVIAWIGYGSKNVFIIVIGFIVNLVNIAVLIVQNRELIMKMTIKRGM